MRSLAALGLFGALALGWSSACGFDVAPVAGGAGGKSPDASSGGSNMATGGTWASSGGTGTDASSDGPSSDAPSAGGTGGKPGAVCGDHKCDGGETCSACPADCPPGGTKDCYENGLHANCCSGPNGNTQDCLACNDDLGCPQDEYAAYCDRFNVGDNLWEQYHRNWVEAQCGGPAQSNSQSWYCTVASTCTTYTCAL